MEEKLKRTNKTNLSDNELILFDVLFDSNVPINALVGGEEFSLRFNYPSHDLDVNQLKDTIEKFVRDGSMKYGLAVIPRDERIVTYVGLTKRGGALWENERLPIWERYVSDSSSDFNGFWELSIFSPNLEAAKEFLEAAKSCNLYELHDPTEILINNIEGKENDLIPWKNFKRMFELKSRLSERIEFESSCTTEWNLYHSQINWWRNVKELDLLKNKIGI
jgi:hypothetical protein